MNPGDLYKTPNNQQRLVLGETADGKIAFVTRGGNTAHDYNQVQQQDPGTFAAAGEFVHKVAPGELARVQVAFEPKLRALGLVPDPADPDAELNELALRNNAADEEPPKSDD